MKNSGTLVGTLAGHIIHATLSLGIIFKALDPIKVPGFLFIMLFPIFAMASYLDSAPPTDANGNWLFDIYNSSGQERGTPTNPLSVTGSFSVTATATNASVGLNGAAIPTSSSLAGGSDGTTLRPLSVSSTGALNVNNNLDKAATGTITTTTGATSYASTLVNGASSLSIYISGTFAATYIFEFSTDGTNYTGLYAYSVNNSSLVNNATTSLQWYVIPCGGYQSVRVRALALTSGSISVTFNAGAGVNYVQPINLIPANFNAQIVGNVASGATDSGNGVKVAGIYKATAPTFADGQRGDLQLDVNGNLKVNMSGGSLSLGSVKINDAAGNALTSTSGALNTYSTGGNVAITGSAVVKLQDGGGNSIGSTAGALNEYITGGNVAITGSAACKISDAAGNALSSTGGALYTAVTTISGNSIGATAGALNTYITGGTMTVSGSSTSKIQDSAGNSLASSSGALNVYSTGGTVGVTGSVSTNVRDGAGTSIGSTGGALNTYLTGGSIAITGSSSCKTQDGSGNSIGSTAGAMNVYSTGGNIQVTNAPLVKLQDAAGNSLASTSGALNVAVTTISGNSIGATGGALNTYIAGGSGFAVTQSGTWNVGLNAGANAIGSVSVSNFPATQAVTQSGTWTIQPGNTANTTPWLVTAAQATAANLNAQIVGNVADAAADSGNTVKVGGVYDSALPTYTTGQRGHFELDANGRLITTTVGNVASGAADSGNGVKTSSVFAGAYSLPTVTSGQRVDHQADNKGRLIISPDAGKATYSASFTGAVTATTATDVFTIFGSASKKITITKIGFSATQTTAAMETFLMNKKTAVNAGGTSAAVTAMAHDSTSAAATATVLSYTANPTTLGGSTTVRSMKKYIVTTTTALGDLIFEYKFNENGDKGIILNSATEGFALNLNSQTMAGNAFSIYVEWVEE